MLHDLQLN